MNAEPAIQTCLLLPFKRDLKAAWKGKAQPGALGSAEVAMLTPWQRSGELAKRDLRLCPKAGSVRANRFSSPLRVRM